MNIKTTTVLLILSIIAMSCAAIGNAAQEKPVQAPIEKEPEETVEEYTSVADTVVSSPISV